MKGKKKDVAERHGAKRLSEKGGIELLQSFLKPRCHSFF
jgi:hypothetical protein